ncbi:MAG: ROK family protein [Verrucomicrobiales bacterium]
MIHSLKVPAPLDAQFLPAALWNRDYLENGDGSGNLEPFSIALEQPGGVVSVHRTQMRAHVPENVSANLKYAERLLKFLLWQRGGSRVLVSGSPDLAEALEEIYSFEGPRAFDQSVLGGRIYLSDLTIDYCPDDEMPEESAAGQPLGRHLDGCRIGFDLGGSDRKAAAVIDGKVVFSEEIAWDPYFQSDPSYHLEGIRDSLRRAAAHLPRVDAIGGSAAGVYVNNEVRAGSLFRGVSEDDFDKQVRRIFFQLKKEWNDVPFEVVNDGDVTALAGSMSMKDNAVLGISLGTSMASGYVDPHGRICPWLNELAFAPVDYYLGATADEWSQDIGCGVQYFSQQAVARLVPAAGIDLDSGMPFPEQLVEVQKLMAAGDDKARLIFETIGVYLGYSIAHYSSFYDIRNVLILGRVTSGEGGEIILKKADEVLGVEFPSLAETIKLSTPDEQQKRHGQAVAAASLPSIG